MSVVLICACKTGHESCINLCMQEGTGGNFKTRHLVNVHTVIVDALRPCGFKRRFWFWRSMSKSLYSDRKQLSRKRTNQLQQAPVRTCPLYSRSTFHSMPTSEKLFDGPLLTSLKLPHRCKRTSKLSICPLIPAAYVQLHGFNPSRGVDKRNKTHQKWVVFGPAVCLDFKIQIQETRLGLNRRLHYHCRYGCTSLPQPTGMHTRANSELPGKSATILLFPVVQPC